MFPLIHGVLAFDTPYNGLSRSMFAYGAFSQYQNLSSVWSIFSTVSTLGAGASTSQILSQTSPAWKKWQAIAARSGTYGAIVAGGVAAYVNRAEIVSSLSKVNKENISQSWSKAVSRENFSQGLAYVSRDSIGEGFAWMGSHLKFVGALMKQAQLKTRLSRLSQLKGVGVVDLYSSLGENEYWNGGYFVPKRTFCAIPTEKEKEMKAIFEEQANPKAGNEIEAHCGMFRADKNPKYEQMAERARDLVVLWAGNDPRRIVDDYRPNLEERKMSISEATLFDDDGKLKNKDAPELEGKSEDEVQLQAILSSSDMPQPEDGGVDEEALKLAAAVPLPADEAESSSTWKSKIMKPFASVSLPTVPRPSIPSIPAFHLPGRGGQKTQEADDQEVAAKVPLPVEVDPEEVENSNMARVDSIDSGVEINIFEVSKDEEEEESRKV
jgi:hypothetical protein